MEQEIDIEVLVAGPQHEVYVDTILDTIAEAAKVRGTGIAKRTHEYLTKKMMEAKAVIALTKDGRFAGFSYIETWENQQYVTTSGLIVHPDFRGHHVARFPRPSCGKAHQGYDLHPGPHPLAARQDLLADKWCCCHGYEHRIGLPTCHLCRPDRRRGFLERLRGMCECGCVTPYGAQILYLHSHAL